MEGNFYHIKKHGGKFYLFEGKWRKFFYPRIMSERKILPDWRKVEENSTYLEECRGKILNGRETWRKTVLIWWKVRENSICLEESREKKLPGRETLRENFTWERNLEGKFYLREKLRGKTLSVRKKFLCGKKLPGRETWRGNFTLERNLDGKFYLGKKFGEKTLPGKDTWREFFCERNLEGKVYL